MRTLVLAGLLAFPPQDALRELGSKDPLVRLEAIEKLVSAGETQAEKALVKALGDDDWEVVERAAVALGKLGGPKVDKRLAEVALEGPVRRLRRHAAVALGELATRHGREDEAADLLSGGFRKHAVNACEALVELGPWLDGKVESKGLDKLLKGRDADARRAAARARVRLAGSERPTILAELLAHEDPAVQAFAAEGAARAADPATLDVLLAALGRARVSDVLERRLQRALRALRTDPSESLAFPAASPPDAQARFARLLGRLGREVDGQVALDPEVGLSLLDPFLVASEANVRRAAAGALRFLAVDAAKARAGDLLREDPDGDVRRIALASVLAHAGPDDAEVRSLLVERLASDDDADVREDLAVALGVRRLEGVAASLASALEDPDWRVVLAAAISLGETRDAGGVRPLIELYDRAAGWRGRASAVAGLARLRAREGVPVVIRALADEEPLVRRTALEFLTSISNRRFDPQPAVWQEWWDENGERVRLEIPDEVLERRRKLRYVKSASEIYQGLDVVVLESEGDHIENVLESLELTHRRTRSGGVVEAELHPEAVFVSNCTGKVLEEEAERLSWFVRAGGYLFGSCWALQETIERLEPGRLRKLRVGDVLGDVPAYACDPASPWLADAYGEDVRPIYHLEGAHLIEVLDPESVEVLVDSPECEAAYGGGNLAAWFRLGHGVVLDSVNHFDLQGFETALGLKKPEHRQAYAIEHMGLTYEELRATRKEKFWSKARGASEKVKDLSVFRLITNFVRAKRMGDQE